MSGRYLVYERRGGQSILIGEAATRKEAERITAQFALDQNRMIAVQIVYEPPDPADCQHPTWRRS